MKDLRDIIAFFFALGPIIGCASLSVSFYLKLQNPYNIILAIIVLIIGLLAGKFIFTLMMRRGIMDILTGTNASYDLDDTEPTPGSGVIKLTPEELALQFSEKKLILNKPVTVTIWGDWEDRGLDNKHQLSNIDYNIESKILLIKFNDRHLIKVKRPGIITCTSDYLKIAHAKEILWQIPISSLVNNQYSNLNTGKDIITKSNTDWQPHSFDLGIGMLPLYLQG